jgi:hypothetical protein
MALPEVPFRTWVLIDPVSGEVFERILTRDWIRYFQTTALQSDTNETGVAANKVKLDGYINVVSQGATGDGVTDDTAAIQAAITACPQGGMVYIPPCASGKFYKLTSSLTVEKAIRIVGAGYHAATGVLDGSVLRQTAAGQAVFDCQAVEGLVIEHLALGGVEGTLSALNLQAGVKRSVFNDLLIPGAGSAGLSIAAAENELNTYESVRIAADLGLSEYATPTVGIRVVGGPNLWSNCSVDGAATGIDLHGYGTWVGLRLSGCVTGIQWSGSDTNIGNVFLNASAVNCPTVHEVSGTPTESRAMSFGDGSGDNAFALPSTVGVNLRASMTTTGTVVPVLTSGDPVFLAPDTESAATVRARLEVRDLNAETETGTSYGGPLVVENLRDESSPATNVLAQFISTGTDTNSVLTIASDDDRTKVYARTASGGDAGTAQTIRINSSPAGPSGFGGGNVSVCGAGELGTGTTNGFLMIPSSGVGNGDVTATPSPANEGHSVPFYFDVNNDKLWVYNAFAVTPGWRYVSMS